MTSESGDNNIAIALQYKKEISLLLAIGGMLSLVIGFLVLFNGTTGNDESIIKIAEFEVTLKGIGAVIMATSLVWAYLAYRARPKYTKSTTTETGGTKTTTESSTTMSQSEPK